jgi:hypothetical protein
MSPHWKRTKNRYERGGMVTLSAGAAKTVPTSSFLPDVNRSPCALVSRLPQRRDRVPSRCGPGRDTAQRVKAARGGWLGVEGARSSWP